MFLKVVFLFLGAFETTLGALFNLSALTAKNMVKALKFEGIRILVSHATPCWCEKRYDNVFDGPDACSPTCFSRSSSSIDFMTSALTDFASRGCLWVECQFLSLLFSASVHP